MTAVERVGIVRFRAGHVALSLPRFGAVEIGVHEIRFQANGRAEVFEGLSVESETREREPAIHPGRAGVGSQRETSRVTQRGEIVLLQGQMR